MTDLEKIVKSVQLITVGDVDYIGVLGEGRIEHATAYKSGFKYWIKQVNIGQAKTINLSATASYTSEDLDLENKEELDTLLAKMLHAKKYFRFYTENFIFDKFLG